MKEDNLPLKKRLIIEMTNPTIIKKSPTKITQIQKKRKTINSILSELKERDTTGWQDYPAQRSAREDDMSLFIVDE
jgi:hypothetical protein